MFTNSNKPKKPTNGFFNFKPTQGSTQSTQQPSESECTCKHDDKSLTSGFTDFFQKLFNPSR